MIARDILRALAARHARKDDLYAEEVQCGRAGLRLDAVAMARSWRAPVIGYEVKASRADLRGDTKLDGYCEFVDRLYIVCPTPLAAEARERNAGVMAMDDAGRLRIVKRAPSSTGARKGELFQGLLINRGWLLRRSYFSLDGVEREATRARAADEAKEAQP